MRKSDKKVEEMGKFIKDYFLENGYAPNVREIGKAMGFSSTSTVSYYLKKLEARNIIRRNGNKNRAIEYLGRDNQWIKSNFTTIKLPLLGNTAGGAPLLAEENIEDIYTFSQNLFGSGENMFCLKVIGNSMKDVGIDDKDTIVVKAQNTANNGEIVVVRTEHGTTVKKIFREEHYIRLQPQNVSHMPMFVKEVEIIGKVIAVIKKF